VTSVNRATGAVPAAVPARSTAAAVPARSADGLFARYSRGYVKARAGQPVAVLAAGCTTAGDPAAGVASSGGEVSVTMIDEDQPIARAAAAGRAGMQGAILGDLRTVPLAPRAFDIVHCAGLLERINHTELVLDRLLSALRPGGLLLLRFCDRDSAAGFLYRALPGGVRRMVWRRRHPGEPGPHPAVYERLVSARGVQSYALLRGLVIGERQALGGLAGGLPPGPPGFLAAQRLVAWLSRGRLTAAHEELLYVLRKPENRFARIL
jgi:SAM-dependent methyltransferase